MTRKEFLKKLGKFFLAGILVYLGKFTDLFGQRTSSRQTRPARFFKQGDDLAG